MAKTNGELGGMDGELLVCPSVVRNTKSPVCFVTYELPDDTLWGRILDTAQKGDICPCLLDREDVLEWDRFKATEMETETREPTRESQNRS